MAALADFDAAHLADPEVVRNPYPFYDRLRAHSPIFGYRDFPPGTVPGVDQPEASWVVLNFEHVAAVAWDHVTFSSRDNLQEASDATSLMLVNHDKPEHTRLRKIAAKAFSPSALKEVAPQVNELARQTIDELIPTDESPIDVMAGYCALLPSRVMGYLLGVPGERDQEIRRWATAFMLSAEMPVEERQACNLAVLEFFSAHVQSHMAGPTGPLLQALRDTRWRTAQS
jgi:cytochrome P450